MPVTPSQPRPTLLVPLLQQTVLTLLSLTLLDGGRVATAGLGASAAFWAGAFSICLRRGRDRVSRGDRFYLKYALPIAWLVGVPLFHIAWSWKKLL